MHFLVKVMLFSAENTIFLYSPGRHALFRGQRHGLSRSASFHEVVRIVPEHGHRETTYEQRGQLGRIAPRLSTSEGFATLRRVSPDTAVIFQRDRRARREGREGLRAQRGCRREQFRDVMNFRLTLDARNERVPVQDPPAAFSNARGAPSAHGPRVTIADRKPGSPSHDRPTASITSDDPLADVTLI